LNIPPSIPPPIAATAAASLNDPFQTPNPIPPVPQLQTVIYNGRELRLTPASAANMAALSALPAYNPPRRYHRNNAPAPVSLFYVFIILSARDSIAFYPSRLFLLYLFLLLFLPNVVVVFKIFLLQ